MGAVRFAVLLLVAATFFGAPIAFFTGCTPGARQEAKTVIAEVLSFDQKACVVARALEGEVDPVAVIAMCDIAPPLAHFVEEELLSAHLGIGLARLSLSPGCR